MTVVTPRCWLAASIAMIALLPNAQPGLAAKSSETSSTRTTTHDWRPDVSATYRHFTSDIKFSPDRSHFFFITGHGDLSCDCLVFDLSVFSTANVEGAIAQSLPRPAPVAVLQRKSAQFRSRNLNWLGIGKADWSKRGDEILFQGADERGYLQSFRFEVATRELIQETSWPFGIGSRSERFADSLISDVEAPAVGIKEEYPLQVLGRGSIREALWPGATSTQWVTYIGKIDQEPHRLVGSSPFAIGFPPAISPDGRWIVQVRAPSEAPDAWTQYSRHKIDQYMAGDAIREFYLDFMQFTLIDTHSYEERPLIDAPSGDATKIGFERASAIHPEALWVNDSRHVVLTNIALPLNAAAKFRPAEMPYVISYDLETRKWEVIEPLQTVAANGSVEKIKKVEWVDPGSKLLISHERDGKPASQSLYIFTRGHWVRTKPPTTVAPMASDEDQLELGKTALNVEIRQSANQPPAVVAHKGNKEIVLTNPDPALAGVQLTRQEEFSWKDASGAVRKGGLLLPNRKDGRPLPLVIQVYLYDPKHFRPDGPADHAYAAQTLVVKGMAVLNVTLPYLETKARPPQEFVDFVDMIDRTAGALAEKGIIDPSKVGIIGFSRAGMNTYYAVTHPGKIVLAAAVDDDGFLPTLAYDMEDTALTGEGTLMDYGGPFWTNKAAWLKHDPSLNLDRVQTPLVMTRHNGPIPTALQTIGGFKQVGVPLEYVNYPDANHNLIYPRQIIESQKLSVDWMSFWLQGVLPEDKDRAKRWSAMKREWDAKRAEKVVEKQ